MPEIDLLFKIIKGVTIASIQLMAISFFYKEFPASRYVLFYSWIIGIIVIYMIRFIILRIEQHILNKGIGCHNTLIIGSDHIGQDIVEKILLFPTFQLTYCGTLDDTSPETLHYHLRNKFNLLGTVNQYKTMCQDHAIDTIFLTKKDLSHTFLIELVSYCEDQNITLKILGDRLLLTPLSKPEIFDGLPIISTGENLSSVQLIIKRLFDIIIGTLLLGLLSPLFIVIGILIKLTSKGPIFYIQKRIKQHNATFNMIKFRSMIINAEHKTGPTMVDEVYETRYTPIGQWLRQWSLDELPQLINIIKGEMSLVGPRPERPHFVTEFTATIPYYNHRHKVPVGLTGWAQINGRSVLTRKPDHKIKYDIYYIKNWSLFLDIKILLKTFFVVLKKEESY